MTLQQHVIDIVERAVKTFCETFLAVWAASNFSFSKTTVVGAIAAGISAVWTTAIKLESARQAKQAIPLA